MDAIPTVQSLHGCPDAVHVVVIVEFLKERADLGHLFVRERGEVFWKVTEFGGDDGPAIGGQPAGDRVEVGTFGDEPSAETVGRNVIVAVMIEGFDVLRAGFDCRRFDVSVEIGVVGFHDAGVVEQELVGFWGTELTFFEENADFGGGTVVVVGEAFDDDWHLVGGVSVEANGIHHEFVVTDAGAFLDGAFDDVAGDGFFAGFFDGSKEACVAVWIGSSEFCGNGDFFNELAGLCGFPFRVDFAFCEEPLTSHEWRVG